mmetsp:Transcript_5581/g.6031  ORF Transcript_5581/g.6031 Transcript_5581/m.6031 type:complete len:189 (-) Transcript_5581:206-772(-)|eukprot:CAMPEP_0176437164 /NCGR_PEP_ID=MMETSP0127-20121128/18441_1 /TAXON_ID=938130 /ORGANISM="Platyophrya macrostoma, Strain WH" /LENGTH=188 /DNA_ID=CAMNT_0017820703 /DNA_START=63 /DNA_END=629 /DNA_ORIENTATION=+
MDNLENLVSYLSLSKSKKSEEKEQKKTKKTPKSSILKEKFADYSPKSPVFKPQQSPNDLPPEIFLPLSDLSTDDNEELGLPQELRKAMSAPSNTQLNILMRSKFDDEDAEFQLVEEDSGCSFLLDENTVKCREESVVTEVLTKDAEGSQLKKQLAKPRDSNETKRWRSRSENYSAFTIFKFLDQKDKF